jgi:hypothetical protein
MYPAMFKFQFHFIARLDDTLHVRKDSIKVCDEFNFTVTTQLRWAKNVSDERGAPRQIMLGAMNPRYCILLALGIFLEVWIESGEGVLGDYLFCVAEGDPEDVKKQIEAAKSNAYSALFRTLRGNEFHKLKEGPLGTHSIRKYASTTPRRSGCTKDDVDYRGRWKGKARMQDTYVDVTLPWPEFKVAAKLCIGAPCKYVLKEGTGLSNNWLAAHVAPNIAQVYGEGVAAVLGKALLWSIFDDVASARVPPQIFTRVMAAYNSLHARHRLPNGENPVKKIQLVASCGESDGEVYLDELPDDADMGQIHGRTRHDGGDDTLLAIQARLASMDRKADDYRNEDRQLQAQTIH